MKFSNDRILKDMNIYLFERFGKDGLLKKITELEERLKALETPKPRGRPRKTDG